MANIIKVRDDYEPMEFESTSELNKFKICEGSSASWTDQEFTVKDLRSRVEPWLTSLFQSEHLSLLVGSGLTHAVHYLAADTAAAGMSALYLSNYKDEIDNM